MPTVHRHPEAAPGSTTAPCRWKSALVAAAVGAAVVALACSSPTRATDVSDGSGTSSSRSNVTTVGCLSVGDPPQPSSEGGTFSLAITASCLWSVSSDQPWLTTSSRPNVWSGPDTIAYSGAANASGPERTGRLSITAGADSVQIPITQPGAGCTYSLTQSTQSVAAPGATLQVGLTAADGCTWTASSNQPWLTITS